jgi:hypothetical protein
VSPAWQPPPRTAAGQKLYDAAAAAMAEDRASFSLDPDELAAKASKRLQRTVALPEGLARLAIAADQQARLNPLGQRTIAAMIGALAVAGARTMEKLAAEPAIEQQRIDQPIFIIGGWRTGTTLLHRLLAQMTRLRAPLYWELSSPIRAGERDAEKRRQLVQQAQAMHDFQYTLNPSKQVVHGSGAELPEECVVAMGKDGVNWGLTATAWMPDYAAWLRQADFVPAYRQHKQMLQILQSHEVDQPPRRWLLKAPAHLAELAALLTVYPDAHIIHLQRDIVSTVASGASLFAVFQSTYSDHVDPLAIGAYQLQTLKLWFERAQLARENPPPGSSPTFYDIVYDDLVADPYITASNLLDALGETVDLKDQTKLRAYLTQNQQNKGGAHRYSPEQFGLTPEQIRSHFNG